MSKLLCFFVLFGFVAAALATEVAVGSADELNAGNGFTEKRAAAPVCGGASIYCNAGSSSGYYCFASPATPSWSCCGCDYGARGFQCGVCAYYSQCYKDFSSPSYYRCNTNSGGPGLSPVGIAMIAVSVFVFIVIVVVIAIIRRRRAYTTVEYTPSYGATVTTQAYPYYAPPPVIVEPAPVIVSDFGYHHHHHHHHSGGYGGGYAAVGFDNGGGSAAVGFDNGGGSNAAIGFSN